MFGLIYFTFISLSLAKWLNNLNVSSETWGLWVLFLFGAAAFELEVFWRPLVATNWNWSDKAPPPPNCSHHSPLALKLKRNADVFDWFISVMAGWIISYEHKTFEGRSVVVFGTDQIRERMQMKQPAGTETFLRIPSSSDKAWFVLSMHCTVCWKKANKSNIAEPHGSIKTIHNESNLIMLRCPRWKATSFCR